METCACRAPCSRGDWFTARSGSSGWGWLLPGLQSPGPQGMRIETPARAVLVSRAMSWVLLSEQRASDVPHRGSLSRGLSLVRLWGESAWHVPSATQRFVAPLPSASSVQAVLYLYPAGNSDRPPIRYNPQGNRIILKVLPSL
jgi:hypothetical protein